MDDDLKQNLTATDTWVRGVFMCLFLIIYFVAKGLWYLIVLFQFVHTLFTGKPNDPLLDFSENLCAYFYEILLYVSFNADERPYPFAPWPNEQTGDADGQDSATEEEAGEWDEGTGEQDTAQPEIEDAPSEETGGQDDQKDQTRE